MAAERVMTGDVPNLGPAVDDREFRNEVKAYLAEIEANLRLIEEWAQRANARLANADEKNRAIAHIDGAEVVGAKIVAVAQEDARRIAETATATATLTEESMVAAARTEADRLTRDARAEADRLIDDARTRATMLRMVEPPESSTPEGPQAPDQSIGSATVARLIVDMEGLQVDLDGLPDEEALTGGASAESLFVFDDEGDDATKRSRYERTSANLPRLGKGAEDVFGVIERLRKTIPND